jgi:hypothetical protein
VLPAAENGVEKIDEVLDVGGGGVVLAVSQVEPEVLLASEKFVYAQGIAIGVLEAYGLPADSA